MQPYKQVNVIADLFLKKEVYALGGIATTLRLLFLFFCIVLLPLFIIIAQTDYNSPELFWFVEAVLVTITALFLLALFLLILKFQIYFYKRSNLIQLKNETQLMLVIRRTLFTQKYIAAFSPSDEKIIFANHYGKVYLIRDFSDLSHWSIEEIANKRKKYFKSFLLTLYLIEESEPNEMTEEEEKAMKEKTYAFYFKIPQRKAQAWRDRLSEYHPADRTTP